ncbi:hypothetical protein L2331_05495 [Mesorhizobium muleiense]|nr:MULTISPECIES: hypothetical protein [Mesorhizobium]MCF6109399.1 hypothetical protein [Mesorhizobium muleiense]
MSVKVAAGLPMPRAPSWWAEDSITIPDVLKPLSAVETVDRAKPVMCAICEAESTPRSRRHRTIRLSGDAEGLSISQFLSEGLFMMSTKDVD